MRLPPLLRHPLRGSGRGLWLALELLLAAVHFPFRRRVPPGGPDDRSIWLQCHCRRVLRVLHVEARIEGRVPATGLLACNHVSYVDILVLGALAPMTFVAKHEVRGWPVFGSLARFAGTHFVRRDRKAASPQAVGRLREDLASGRLLVVFPEGTSTDGSQVLPFKSTLLEAVRPERDPVHAGCLHYPASNGNVADEICYWRDMTLLPHLLNLLARPGILAVVGFSTLEGAPSGRKSLASALHRDVLTLKGRLQERHG